MKIKAEKINHKLLLEKIEKKKRELLGENLEGKKSWFQEIIDSLIEKKMKKGENRNNGV